MILLNELTDFDWLLDCYSNKNTKPRIIGDFVPHNYSAYCKILHKMFEDPNYTNLKFTYQDVRNGLVRIEDEDYYSNNIYSSEIPSFKLNRTKRVTWKELSERFGVEYNSNIKDGSFSQVFKSSAPIYLYGGNEGTMDKEDIDKLLPIITKHSNSRAYYFFFTFLCTKDYEDELFKGDLNEIYELSEMHRNYTPTYFWDEKKEWLVWTDYDLEYTIVCGTNELINDILKNEYFEAFKIELDLEI